MIERKRELTAGRDQARRSSQRVMHGSRVMQDPPRIDHIKTAETADVPLIKDRALLYRPFAVAGKKAFPQLCRANHGIFIKVERMHARAQPARGERKQSATRTNVEKTQLGEAVALE